MTIYATPAAEAVSAVAMAAKPTADDVAEYAAYQAFAANLSAVSVQCPASAPVRRRRNPFSPLTRLALGPDPACRSRAPSFMTPNRRPRSLPRESSFLDLTLAPPVCVSLLRFVYPLFLQDVKAALQDAADKLAARMEAAEAAVAAGQEAEGGCRIM